MTRRRPATHPVLRRQAVLDAWRALDVLPGNLDPVAANERAFLGARVNDLAIRVVELPDVPLSPVQRQELHVIARELLRRAQA